MKSFLCHCQNTGLKITDQKRKQHLVKMIILGDGIIHPVDLIKGPSWLVGFKGNEMQRILRRLKFEGDHIRMNIPEKYASICRRIKYFYWRYNFKFGGKKK
jgi:hypothetical protein